MNVASRTLTGLLGATVGAGIFLVGTSTGTAAAEDRLVAQREQHHSLLDHERLAEGQCVVRALVRPKRVLIGGIGMQHFHRRSVLALVRAAEVRKIDHVKLLFMNQSKAVAGETFGMTRIAS